MCSTETRTRYQELAVVELSTRRRRRTSPWCSVNGGSEEDGREASVGSRTEAMTQSRGDARKARQTRRRGWILSAVKDDA